MHLERFNLQLCHSLRLDQACSSIQASLKITTGRQLLIDELREAVAIDPDEEIVDLDGHMDDETQIVSVWQGLVEVDRESQVIRLVHYITQEYFENERKWWLPDGDLQIVRSCLAYLSMDVFIHDQREWHTDLATTVQHHKLLEYAGKQWSMHARAIQDRRLQTEIVTFLSDDSYLRCSSMVTFGKFYEKTYQREQSDVSAMHISAHFGLVHLVQDLTQQGDCKDSSLRTPLLRAVDAEHAEVIKLLLAQPGIEDPNMSCVRFLFHTGLS